MPAFIYLCDMTTERECLDRLLFGTNNGDNYAGLDLGDRPPILRQQNPGEDRRQSRSETTTNEEYEEKEVMALTRDFKETVKDRADRDPEFRKELLAEALEAIVCGVSANPKKAKKRELVR